MPTHSTTVEQKRRYRKEHQVQPHPAAAEARGIRKHQHRQSAHLDSQMLIRDDVGTEINSYGQEIYQSSPLASPGTRSHVFNELIGVFERDNGAAGA